MEFPKNMEVKAKATEVFSENFNQINSSNKTWVRLSPENNKLVTQLRFISMLKFKLNFFFQFLNLFYSQIFITK